jgi:co-chaperonin GroES (HSP10)
MTPMTPIELKIVPIPEERIVTGVLRPTGYRVLLRILPPEAKSKSWVHMPEDVREREWGAQLWAEVIDLGPDAYKDERKFPTGAWCRPGDCVVIRPYSGTRFNVDGLDKDGKPSQELYALVNDDTVCGVLVSEDRAGEIRRA